MRIFTAAFAIAAGFIVLLGYFFPAQLESFRLLLVDWAIVIAAMAVLVGIFNLIAVQWEKIRDRQKGGIYGVILIVSLLVTFVSGLLLRLLPANHPYTRFYTILSMDAIIVPVEASLMAILAVTLIYSSIRLLRRRVDVMSVVFLVVAVVFLIAILTMDAIIVPVEASLMAILAVTLIYSSIRLLRRRVDVMSVVFLVVAVVFLIAILPTPFGPLLGERGNQALVDFLDMFSHGGMRGLLIGIALGTLLTGLRVLFGIDRPYGGN